MTPREVVEKWMRLFQAADIEGMVALYAPDALNHQMPDPPARGLAAIREMLKGYVSAPSEPGSIHIVHEAGDVVVVEWGDPDGFRGCDIYEVHDDLITEQRGYWDRASMDRFYGNAAPPS